ncbi:MULTISPECIES: SOS response-associated peptidase [unclassified Cellulophaga]|uniref:SOS response-associated peptidase n=1 Tax=unclassified Cellulophaga TaxID=2634405 RepID=UPI0026E45F1E|nr:MULTISPECIES: SOS response-associated peptidase family protein [unclassified Cellulophaga]MDO6490162.1 SOS response-associated peptidase family protein [Cellulophaga sp. 2_MG-2023]MDO6494644.1 SOS response-associated peptidase family protein [Cellulophaga sp. 3_MG-2023]
MCYGIRVVKKAEEIKMFYNIKSIENNKSVDSEHIYNYANGFAHPNLWVLPQEKIGYMVPMKWGLIPPYELGENSKEYYKKTVKYGSGLNARSEKLFYSNNYKNSATTKRCIIPVDGFYEPHTATKNGKDFKIPFYFQRKNEAPINVAGIYTLTKDNVATFTILTKEATPLFSKIHNKKNRRPVLLQDADIDVWLDNSLTESDIINVIDDDMPDELLTTYPISKDLYKRDGQGNREGIITPVKYDEIQINYK